MMAYLGGKEKCKRHPDKQGAIHRLRTAILGTTKQNGMEGRRRSSMAGYSQSWMDGGSWGGDSEHSSFCAGAGSGRMTNVLAE